MYVRLGFSVAINVDPDVLLVDEVLAVGDEEFQRGATRSSPSSANAGRTIVVVTHDLGSVRTMSDRAVWLSYGELRSEGSAGDVIGNYADETMGQRHEGEGEHEGSRWGTGEIKITKVSLLDPDGRPTQHVRTGDDVTIRYEYDARVPVRQPVFGLAVLHLSGHMLSGPNTRDTGDIPDVLYGRGIVDIRISALPLLPGSYDINAGVWDFPLLHAYDQRNRVTRFDVLPGDRNEVYGMLTLRPRWEIGSGTPPGERPGPAETELEGAAVRAPATQPRP